MVLQTETYELDDEAQRLQENLDELKEMRQDMAGDHPAQGELASLVDSLNTQLHGVEWARDKAHEFDAVPSWEEPVDAITLAGLDSGGVARVEDNLPEGAGGGAVRNESVAAGSLHPGDKEVEDCDYIEVPEPAPYVGAEQSDEDRLAVVAGLPDPFVRWAEQRIDDLTTLSGNGQLDFGELRKEIQRMSTQA